MQECVHLELDPAGSCNLCPGKWSPVTSSPKITNLGEFRGMSLAMHDQGLGFVDVAQRINTKAKCPSFPS